jgi:maltooligosyltrehalose trehalohydrolase
MLDVVYNHLGPAGNYLARFGPYFTDRYRTPWGEAVNLDGEGSDEVRRFFCDNAVMWLRDYQIDGLRVDAVHAFVDTSATHFLEQLAAEVRALEAALGRHLCVVAESDLNDPRIVRSREAGGYGLDAQWSDDFHHALHTLLTGERTGYYADFGSIEHLARALTEVFVYAGRRSPFRQRVHGRPPADLPGWRFVVASQNHDQVGNRATGDRLTHLVSPGKLRIAAALLLCSPFVPLLFQGEEWAASSPFLYFTSHDDPALAMQVSEGRRREFAAFGWEPSSVPDPQAPETFRRSRLSWGELAQPDHAAVLDWYRALIALRRDHAVLRDGRYRDVGLAFDEEHQYLIVRRGELVVGCNVGSEETHVAVTGSPCVLLASEPGARVENGMMCLPPESVVVARIEETSSSEHA